MKLNYQKTLTAAAAAALVSAPVWSAPDISSSDFDATSARYAQAQEYASLDHHHDRDRRDKDADAKDKLGSNPFHSRTPDELSGMDVIGADGETIGKIKTVVMDRNGKDIHVVISSGGVLGIGDRETVVPLSELTLRQDDKVESKLTEESIESRPEFQEEQYGVMESDRRISDLSAYKPTGRADDQGFDRDDFDSDRRDSQASRRDTQAHRGDADTRRTAGVAGRSKAEERDAKKERDARKDRDGRMAHHDDHSTISASELHRHTPKELEGMTVVGVDGEKLGKVKAVVASNDRAEVNAVISTGGFLGIGARDVLLSLDQLTLVDEDELEANTSKESAKSLPEYQDTAHTKLDPDRPISEYWHETR